MKDVYIHGWVSNKSAGIYDRPQLMKTGQVFNLATGHIEDLGISQGPESLNKANGTNGTNGSA